MKLRIRIITPNPIEYIQLREYYSSKRANHSTDSGLDLICPRFVEVPEGETTKIPLGISCEVVDAERPHGYYLYPRSSIYKTPMRLANSVGIIDYGYRGEITAVVDYYKNQYEQWNREERQGEQPYFMVLPGSRFFQICSPDLSPVEIELVEDELSETTRGNGGFGSTNE
jgi:dUTP pyrophosphatase